MKKIILFTLFFTPCQSLFSQQFQLTGKVINEKNTPIEFAEVLVLKKDSTVLKSELTNEKGNFYVQILNGSYIIQIKKLKDILYSQDIDIQNNLNIGNIKIEKAKNIKEIVLEGKKKLIERKIDRTIFNVENSIFSTGADLAQVLAGTPMLSINDNSISIIGKSGVAVMINDKILNLSGTDLINYLKSLRSDDISKIEIITTPPAKYEAQGNSGMLNIILKKNVKLGWSGTLSSSYVQTTYSGNANNITLNYNSNKITSSLRLRQYDRPSKALEFIDIIGGNSILSSDNRKDMFKGIGANLSFDYKLNQKSNIGVVYDIGKSHINMDIDNQSIYKTNNVKDSTLTTFSHQKKPIKTHSLYGYYDYKIDSSGKKLSIGVNYFSNNPDAEVYFQTETNNNPSIHKIKNTSNLDYKIVSGQADLYLPYKWATIETGLKFTRFSNNSNVQYFRYQNGDYAIDNSKSNIFEYKENNAATYISVSKDFGKKWAMKVGLRYEYSTIGGYSETINERNENNYSNFFPTAYLAYKSNENNTFSINYSKRINRPNFSALNPFRWYSNPYSFYTGNPFLSPSYNHNLEFSYLYKSKLSVTLYGQKFINGYGKITTLKEGIKEVNYKNYLTQYDLGLNMSLYTNPTKWWENNINLISFYSTSESSIPEVVPQKGFSIYYTINNTFTLNKKKSILFLLNFFHNLPSRQGNTYSEHISSLSTGLRFSLMEKKMRINMMMEDILKGTQSKGKLFYDNFTQFYNNYYDGRRFTLSVTYTFGNKNVKANNKQILLEEKNRAN
ncbi:TonB-dependent receptor [Elizabethkingia anophelis]|uniref:outer membrane beta-barrel family protein n=1 Tax=Elizabethkingia anophelis TaxID=1117645 RepID=UPI0021A6853D|nr:TonB-dependent receptor [Elizabethkingia anophelis]MDV4072180.1 TonB-dependent receptor [Elizabethkingia anophelis]